MKKTDEHLIWMVLYRILLHAKPIIDGWKSDFKITFTNDEKNAIGELCEYLKMKKK